MKADARGWSLAAALMTTIAVTAMASHANGEEPLFQLTPQIERLGGETLTPDSGAATEAQSSQDDSLQCEELRLTGPVEVESIKWRLIRGGVGARVLVPAEGPAPISLDFAFPTKWDGESDGVERMYDHPTTPGAPQRDDSHLLAAGKVESMTLPFNR